MPLGLYRRHRQSCEGEHPEDSCSGEFEERSKKWKECGCVIFASGVLAGKFRRRRTGRFIWEEAKAVAARWESAGQWEGTVRNPGFPTEDQTRTTIEHAVTAFLADHDTHSSAGTRRKYGYLMAQLRRYSDHKSYILIEQWGPPDVRGFRDSWGVREQTALRYMSVIRSFFEFCFDNEWIGLNPAKMVKNPRGKSHFDVRGEQKLPFSDDELKRMYDAAENRYGKTEITWSRQTHHHLASGLVADYKYKWTGQDLADFISVSVYTGLRISDVATFHASRMKDTGEINIRTAKSGTNVCTWVPEWLQEVIRRRSLAVGSLIFGEHETRDMNVITDLWRRKLKRLWAMCGPWKDKPTPHRFRHTFARVLLERPGVTVRDVAELLGNTEEMVRKHYSAWIPARQESLTAILKEAFTETPRPNVVIQVPESGTK